MSDSNGGVTFWKIAGPVFATFLLAAISATGFLLDRRMGRIEDDVKTLIRMHMTPAEIREVLCAAY